MFDYTAVPWWVLVASLMVWALAIVGLMAILRMIRQFTKRRSKGHEQTSN